MISPILKHILNIHCRKSLLRPDCRSAKPESPLAKGAAGHRIPVTWRHLGGHYLHLIDRPRKFKKERARKRTLTAPLECRRRITLGRLPMPRFDEQMLFNTRQYTTLELID